MLISHAVAGLFAKRHRGLYQDMVDLVSRDLCCFSSVWDWSVRATGNEVRVEVPVELMTMIKTRVLEGLNLHLVLLSMFPPHYSGAITTALHKESDWLSSDHCQMNFFLYDHGHQWQACLKKNTTELKFLVHFALFIFFFSSAQIDCCAFDHLIHCNSLYSVVWQI